MKLTVRYDEETGLIDLISSSGTISLSKTEIGGLYILLKKVLGVRGRFALWRRRKAFKQV